MYFDLNIGEWEFEIIMKTSTFCFIVYTMQKLSYTTELLLI